LLPSISGTGARVPFRRLRVSVLSAIAALLLLKIHEIILGSNGSQEVRTHFDASKQKDQETLCLETKN
jgi:hypothetical protein